MALTKISRGLLNTGVSDSSDATAITIDSSERVGFGITSPSDNIHILGNDSTPNAGITIQTDDTANAQAGITLMSRNSANTNVTATLKNVTTALQSSLGITFGSDTAAANTLDDYEEGSWTPTFAGVAAVSIYGASYTKIGQLVMVEAYILGTTQNNTNQFQIGGLPYTSQNINVYGGGSIGYTYSQDFSDFGSPLIPNNSTYIYFHRLNGNQPSVTNAILYSRNSGNQYFLFQAIYSTT